MTKATPVPAILHLERRFEAPARAVFDAWTQPEVLRRWWAAGPGWTCTVAEVDLREGGRYRLAMTDPLTGRTYTVGGTYLEVRRPERLVFDWTWEGDLEGQEGSGGTRVVVEFRPVGDATVVTLTHEGFAGHEVRDRHAHGWRACMGNLAASGLVR